MFSRDIVGVNASLDAYRRASYLPRTAYQMKRVRPQYLVRTTKRERMAKIARNPLAFQNRRAIVPYRSGTVRTGGFYGRYGQAARDRGLVPEKKFLDTALSFNLDFTAECQWVPGYLSHTFSFCCSD